MMKVLTTIISAAAIMLGSSCSGGSASAETKAEAGTFTEQGAFSADSAFSYVKAQTAMGPRVPGSEAHSACGDWLASRLQDFGADTVSITGTPVKAWDGTTLPVRNVFARYNTDATTRILLVAHYDTRPWADHDPDPSKRLTPIDGANDGASGVGVLLEVARNLGMKRPEIGVDILLTDCEDYGARDDAQVADSEATWCLGTQQFVENLPYTAATMPRLGILLDMVGGKDAKFHQEYFSANYAPQPTARVWAMAKKMGLGERFPMSIGGAITDDHIPLLRAGIPTTDIIECANPSTGSFNPTWHTLSDNIDNIDPATLAAAGRVVLNVIYTEKP